LAVAKRPSALAIVVEGACPDREALTVQMSELLPETRIENRPDAMIMRVRDLGSRYAVSVAGSERQFPDALRDCSERARVAAAFVLIILEPPSLAAAELPPRDAGRFKPRAPRFVLEALGAVAGAPRTTPDNSLFMAGAALRAAATWGWLGLSFGIAGLSPDAMQFPAAKVRLWRVPFDLSLRGLIARKHIDFIGDLGLALTVLFVRGVAIAEPQSHSRLEPGIQLQLALRIWLASRLALVAGGAALLAFQASQLAVDPVGVIGTTPRAWLCGFLGLAVRIH
jgi:hypothetical protein